MSNPTESDVTLWREERDRLVAEVLAQPAPTAYFQSSERIASHIERSEGRERRIAELDGLIAAYEDDHA
jgi:hypothetical protein